MILQFSLDDASMIFMEITSEVSSVVYASSTRHSMRLTLFISLIINHMSLSYICFSFSLERFIYSENFQIT